MSTSNQVSDIAIDPDLFECFYREHIEQVRRFVSRRVSDACLAADLTDEIFLAAIDAAPGYRPERGSASAWLRGIARNVLAEEVRRQVRELQAARRISGRRLLGPEPHGLDLTEAAAALGLNPTPARVRSRSRPHSCTSCAPS